MPRASRWAASTGCALVFLWPRCVWSDAEAVRQYFEGVAAGGEAVVAGEVLRHAEVIAAVYGARRYEPLWTADGPLTGQLASLRRAIEASRDHGLDPAAFHIDALLDERRSGLALELSASDAFAGQAIARSAGMVSPADLDPDWHISKAEVDAARVLLDTAASRRVGDVLASLWPDNDEYRALVATRRRILASQDVEAAVVPEGPVLKRGQSGPRVALLKERLFGPGEHSAAFDEELAAAVVAFQRVSGLKPDGTVGAATLEVLNATRFSWIDRLDANLERWRWLPRRVPRTYIRVNVAAFTLRVIANGEKARAMDVVVGRPYRQTPVFADELEYLVFNPFWNVPYKLAVQDKLPLLKADAAALAAQGYEVKLEGSDTFVPVDVVAWEGESRSTWRHLLRQRPGPFNALGRVKFMLPNPHAIYLHDTPNRELFARAERGFSSGCIRLAEPLELAEWVLSHDGQTREAARTEALVAAGETLTLSLRTPLPVYLVYFTAFTDAEGDVVFRRDIYGRDSRIVTALRSGG